MKTILSYLEATAARLPDKIAIRDESHGLTFSQLQTLARAGGSALLARGLSREPVAVFLPKEPETAAAFFAVLYAGCSYVPLDNGMPLFRIRAVLNQVRPRAVICDAASAGVTEELGFGNAVILSENLFAFQPDLSALEEARSRAADSDPMHIIFTSGSTGEPKGVVTSHRSVIDYAEALCPTVGFSEETVFAMQVPFYVDACLKELLGCIRCGAAVVLMPQKLFLSPIAAVEFLNRWRVNTLCWVSSALTMLSGLGAFEECRPEYLKTVCFGSEVFPPAQLRLWQAAAPGARFFNLYGPTECTGMSFYHEVAEPVPDGTAIPVGRPFENTGFFLLKEDESAAAPGETGEICIYGTRLALGYYGRPELTAEAFPQNPLNLKIPERIYRTGDLGCLNENGDLIFLCRKDSQIKNMGYRVEPAEIEACACCCPGISAACCCWVPEKKKLLLYYMGQAEEKALRAHLLRELPRYMLPAKLIYMDTLPLLPNGKLDRRALLAQQK